ncbi:hypothetical protein TrRE_jg8704 [Triparma retinervis]|uniref:Uncharacterized protein n=1 Tax=Triparma retinervis TaxID=2557542 RepID=A0A9W6Z654_9STRA|nr:hypothetical protein TrRE_jg8704 [Triparma retinervis]
MARFLAAAESFVKELLRYGTAYETSITEDIGSGDDPSKRVYKVIFAKPSKKVPVPPASAHIKVLVNFENTKYVVKGFIVEGKKQVFSTDFPFNEAWIDGVIARKIKLRDSFDFVGGSGFLKTRLNAVDGEG